MAVIDFHSHVLPGIDDGSRNLEMSAAMLQICKDQGVDIMAATPHFYADRDRIDEFLERRRGAWRKIQMNIPLEDRPKLLLGAEVAFFEGISRADQIGALTIGKTNILLLEMPFRSWEKSDLKELERLCGKYRVLLAHVERFPHYPGNKKMVGEAISLPLHVQINAEGLLRWSQRGSLLRMFRDGEAHFLGSDTHGIDRRPPNLAAGRAVLAKKLGADFLAQMDENAAEFLVGR